jgi:hypothetical protein
MSLRLASGSQINKSLARAVIGQAIMDALNPTTPERIRRDAKKFLCGQNHICDEYCKEAGINPKSLRLKR